MKPYILFLTSLIFIVPFSYAQREASNWYFGANAGISFNNGAPVALTDGQMNQGEGVATISDANGNLLFYTDGANIWNRNHAIMQNGFGLNGDGLSSQSGVIVPMPNNPNIYYVFTVSNWPTTGTGRGLFYSIVDMSLDNGNGGVTLKNDMLNLLVREQVSSVYHENCRDVWIVSHEKGNNNNFLAYLLTPAGLQKTPIVSPAGMTYNGGNRYGYLRFSSSGRKLCSTLGYAITGASSVITVQLFDFDKSTGVVSNPITLSDANFIRDAYSSEFSADNTKLYVTAYNAAFIYQFDLSSGNPATIAGSAVNIATGAGVKSCVQMGPDKRIYVSRVGQSYLGLIREPDKPGALCGYVDNGVDLNGKTCQLGLPNFMQSFFSLPYLGVDSSICPGGSLLLNAYTRPGETYLWQDGSTGPTFHVAQAGQYWVEVTNGTCMKRDDIKIDLTPLPVVNLGADTAICGTATILLDATASTGATYSWQDGAVTPTYTVNNPGTYSVQVTVKGCSGTDAITVNPVAPPTVDLGNDTTICTGANLPLDAFTVPGNRYTWYNGATSSSIVVNGAGKYWVDVANTGCSISDTILVTTIPGPVVNLGNDTTICTNLLLDATAPGSATYEWKNGATSATLTVSNTGEYWVKVTDNGCSTSDTIQVQSVPAPSINLGNDTTICSGSPVPLNAFTASGNTYLWQDGTTASSQTVTMPGEYWVEVSNAAACSTSDTIMIFEKSIPDVYLGEDTLLCANTGLLLQANHPGGIYRWHDGSTAATYNVTQPGTYWLQVTENGCSKEDTIVVGDMPVLNLGRDTTICLSQVLHLKAIEIPGATYTWQDGSNQPEFTVTQAGTYKVDVTTGCGTQSDVVVVKMEDCNCKINIPNAFTPNGNYSNNVFKPLIQHCLFAEYNLKIFNRWGERIFETGNPLMGWDGSYKGRVCDVGAYVYVVSYRSNSNADKKVKHGTVMLIR